MALDPRLLLLDEPTTGLDPNAGRALDEVVLGIKRRGGKAVVAVSHDVASIETIADRVVMLAHGRVVASGTLDEVRASADEHVRAFFERRSVPGARHASLVEQLEWRG
jgi:phospholipid/cholesterol/gamma-HCH transport system ATP-binding protein